MTLHRTCTAALGLCERKNELWLGLFFLFFCYSKTIRESKGMVKTKQIKTCRKKRHVRIGNMKERPNLTESSKSPASIAKSNKQWVGTCLYQEWYKPLLISCEAAIRCRAT